MCGGFDNEELDADDEVKALALEMKPKVEKALGTTFGTFEAVKYVSQLVAGTNYKIKVKVGDKKYVHIEVYVPLPCKKAPNELLSQEAGKSLEDEL